MKKKLSASERKQIADAQMQRWREVQFNLPIEDTDSQQARDCSAYAAVVNHILDELCFPSETRSMLDALIEVSEGKLGWFEIDDYSLGCIAKSEQSAFNNPIVQSGANYKKESLQKWVQRSRKKLLEWAEESKVNVFQCQPGGKSGSEGAKHPSRYKLPILILIDDAFNTATMDARFEADPNKIIEIVVKSLIKSYQGEMKQRVKKERFNRGRETQEKYLKMSLTYFQKFAVQATEEQLTSFLEEIQNRLALLKTTLKGGETDGKN